MVREEFAVPGRLAYRLARLRGQRAIGKARRATAAALVRHARTTSGELLVEVDVVIARSRHRKKKLAQARMALKVGLSVRSLGQTFASDRM